MSDKLTYGRRPVVLVGLKQPRCSNRFGALPCRAGLGSLDVSSMTYDFRTSPLGSEYSALSATLSASPVNGIRFTATGANAQFRIPGTASVPFAGNSFRYVIMRGVWRSGVADRFFLRWYNDAGYVPTGTGVATATLYTKSGDEIALVDLSAGQEFLAVWDVSDATDYAAEWQGQTIDGIRLDMSSTTTHVLDILQIQVSEKAFPTTGTPKCYQTYWTCGDTENYNTDASITWMFSRENDDVDWLYEETGDDIRTNAIPMLLNVSTSSSRLNVGSSRTGESPLGRRATAQIAVANRVWDDHVGDPYLADRPDRDPVGFWTLFDARNAFTPGFEVTAYEGYSGQALDDMQARLLNLEDISGPDGSGNYTLSCRDPLDALRGKNAQYPPRSQIELAADIDATQTAIPVVCAADQLSIVLGNTGSTRYLVIGDEVISYTGWTGTAPEFTLTGVVRGVINSMPDDHSAEDSAQRGAYHVNQRLYDVARYVIKDHTTVKDSYIIDAQWDAEGGTYLSTLQCTTFLPDPNDVEKVLGELCRDGLFSIWWDERSQKIPLLAVRPPRGTPLQWTDDGNIETLSQETKSDERMTRVSVYFGPRDFLGSLTDPLNFDRRRIRIDAEVESEQAAGGKIFDNTIFSRWTKTFGNALLVGSSLLLRYRLPPKYITVTLDAKDNAVQIGDVVDLTTRKIRDAEGLPIVTRWQVIGVDDKSHATKLSVMMQSFAFVGKFAIIMANDAPNYSDATDEEKLEGCWLADDATGLMPDGSDPYLLQ